MLHRDDDFHFPSQQIFRIRTLTLEMTPLLFGEALSEGHRTTSPGLNPKAGPHPSRRLLALRSRLRASGPTGHAFLPIGWPLLSTH